MHVAAKRGHQGLVKLLLDKGANVAGKTRDGLIPLHCATRSGHLKVPLSNSNRKYSVI